MEGIECDLLHFVYISLAINLHESLRWYLEHISHPTLASLQ
jgi:hypothetical protein